MTLTFVVPDDQSWDPSFWDRIGIGPGWDRFTADLEKLGAVMEDIEDVGLTFPAKKEADVRALVQAARSGAYGSDLSIYWSSATEK